MRNLRPVKNYTDTGVTTTTDTGLVFTQFYRDRLFVVIFQGLNCAPQNRFFVREIHFFVQKNNFSVQEIHIFVKKGLTPDDTAPSAQIIMMM
jgi:hypothetical protein